MCVDSSTGKPKGVLHTTGGYMVYSATTSKYIFDLQQDDIFFCTADCGWITGHSYVTYGPLLNGATQLVFEGVPSHPDPGRMWRCVDKHQVTQLYTAPTAIRALMRSGEDPVKATSRKSLKLLGSVGEPINPEAWRWYHEVVGEGRCPIVDTWWQTETGGIMITPLPTDGFTQKPGCASRPFFGVQPCIITPEGKEIEGACEGLLAIKGPWPSTIRDVLGDYDRYVSTYFPIEGEEQGYYLTGDGCRRDEDGYYWITGRVDDVINTRFACAMRHPSARRCARPLCAFLSDSPLPAFPLRVSAAIALVPRRSSPRSCCTPTSPRLPSSASRTQSRARASTSTRRSTRASSRPMSCSRSSRCSAARRSVPSLRPT